MIGEHVWGGSQPRVLSDGMRIVAVGAAGVLSGMATVVARRAGLVGRPARWLTPGTWTIAGYRRHGLMPDARLLVESPTCRFTSAFRGPQVNVRTGAIRSGDGRWSGAAQMGEIS